MTFCQIPWRTNTQSRTANLSPKNHPQCTARRPAHVLSHANERETTAADVFQGAHLVHRGELAGFDAVLLQGGEPEVDGIVLGCFVKCFRAAILWPGGVSVGTAI